jgi:hypothetical protein
LQLDLHLIPNVIHLQRPDIHQFQSDREDEYYTRSGNKCSRLKKQILALKFCGVEKMQYSQRAYLAWDVLSLEIHEYNTITLSYTQTVVASPGEAAKSWPYMSSHTTQGIHC